MTDSIIIALLSFVMVASFILFITMMFKAHSAIKQMEARSKKAVDFVRNL